MAAWRGSLVPCTLETKNREKDSARSSLLSHTLSGFYEPDCAADCLS
jgi:hypothetical protein